MLLSLREWIHSLWRVLLSTSSPVTLVTRLLRYCSTLLVRNKAGQQLQIESARDLSPLYEVFPEEDDEDGSPIFLYSSFGFVSDRYIAYFGQSKLRKRRRVPPGALEHPNLCRTNKQRCLFEKAQSSTRPSLHLLDRPHPNLIRYRGCLIERGRIVGIVLDRHPMTLKRRLENGIRGFNVENCMREITSAVNHLHSIGLAHNDLTPMNIMVDEHDTSIIVDFGSCQPFGCELITAGTPGWIDEDFTHSVEHHDVDALHKLQTWFETQV
ncbi:hypothetical protein BU23DRAFT_295763 [Bimuria novae-zelandiae CBS 107.79]|uniref:Protein kinase domain-containing protein n=1 Tax=Bimuria novae-zelandiae CBS 107.79 TaxID=1447943 RepID=A0A6A5VLJ1_9PLEO|nr:hypothetical protein BU23DRAFT_295763 [Bimuria novae-zelandiae CBS 107.79]